MSATVTRRSMAARVTIGQTWRRRHDQADHEVRQVHRLDRLAELDGPGGRIFVPFTELRTRWVQL